MVLGTKKKKENYPDICIGYNEHNKDEEVIEKLKVLLKDYNVKEIFPYNGSIYQLHFEHNKHLKTVMIEINKSLYMDEDTFEKKKEFEILKEKLIFFDFFDFLKKLFYNYIMKRKLKLKRL